MVLRTLLYLSKWFPKFAKKIESIEDWYRQWREYAPPRKFECWCLDLKSIGKDILRASYRVSFSRPDIQYVDTTPEDELLRIIMERASARESINLLIDGSKIINCSMDFFEHSGSKYEPKDMEFTKPSHFYQLDINGAVKKLTIRGGIIENLIISMIIPEIIIENCCIGRFSFKAGNQPNMRLENCWIGKLTLHGGAVHDFLIKDGWICNIKTLPPEEANPFRGSVTFKNVGLPTSEDRSALYKGSQQYRNLRSHFEKLQNGPMAGLMRAKELASDRESDSGVSWFFNWVYCIASGYGRRPGWAFIWSLVFLLINIMILTGSDGVRVDSLNLSQGTWQLEWQGDGFRSQFGRASILTFQTVINPFTIFVAKSAFKFNSLWGTIHTFFFVLLADAAFVFGSLAIRKRLKFS